MYIRRTSIKSRKDGGQYYTYRLVRSKRIGGKVRQHTLLNLGTGFTLPREQWPELASRIQNIIDGQLEICKTPQEIEELAQTLLFKSFNHDRKIKPIAISKIIEKGSELSTHYWLKNVSGLGELIDYDFNKLNLYKMYTVSDQLLKHKQAIEKYLYLQEKQLFGFHETITLYDCEKKHST